MMDGNKMSRVSTLLKEASELLKPGAEGSENR